MGQDNHGVTDLPAGLDEFNSRRYARKPKPTTLSFEDIVDDGTTLTAETSATWEILTISLECGERGKPRHQLLTFDLDAEQIVELHEKIIAPFLAIDAEAERLAGLARAEHEREEAARKAAEQEHSDACAFQIQKLERPRGMSHTDGDPLRLHRRSCTRPARASRAGRGITKLHTLDELVTEILPATRERFEKANNATSIARNARRDADRQNGRQRHTTLDTTLLTLCGVCKPLGDKTKEVNTELDQLANRITADPDTMVRVAQVLLRIEQAAEEIDAEHQQRRAAGDL